VPNHTEASRWSGVYAGASPDGEPDPSLYEARDALDQDRTPIDTVTSMRKEPMPTPPRGATLEELDVWQREVLTPWVIEQRNREANWANNGRETGRDRQRNERLDDFARQVENIDRVKLIASLKEVDVAELLD
jgi:hypothetical protein